MFADDTPMVEVNGEDPRHREMADRVIFLQSITQALIRDAADPAVEMSYLMTAAAHFAGGLLGQLIVIGAAKEQDKRRATEAAATNFRAGIESGRRSALRAVTKHTQGNA